jgi:hypothetical protein
VLERLHQAVTTRLLNGQELVSLQPMLLQDSAQRNGEHKRTYVVSPCKCARRRMAGTKVLGVDDEGRLHASVARTTTEGI